MTVVLFELKEKGAFPSRERERERDTKKDLYRRVLLGEMYREKAEHNDRQHQRREVPQ